MKSPSTAASSPPGGRSSLILLACLVCLSGLSGCAPILTAAPSAMPSQTPVQMVVGSPVNEAALQSRNPASSPGTNTAPAEASADKATPGRTDHTSVDAAPTARPPMEPRFDLIVNNAPARDVFLALAADGRYNVLTHPELSGNISVTLRGVTMRDALEALRDVYGYDFKLNGRRITVFPPTMQSRVFVVNYLHSQRSGRSDVRVSSGAAPANQNNNSSSSSVSGTAGGSSGNQPDSSQISTQSRNDLWSELGDAVKSMIGTAGGRHVIVNPQSGMLAVRAMPDELRQVEAMLSAARLAVERQVMLDVKIVQVELREGFQSGIDWSVLRKRGAIGTVSASGNPLVSNPNGLPTLPSATALLADALTLPSPANGLFGLSLATDGFQSVLGFLETHGEVQTLSSPRLATLNNQKAVLKVGTDDYFVTNVSGGSVTPASNNSSNNSTTTMPTLTLTPFFSGIALDVTPQIDAGNMITLHVHPSVSNVAERTKQVDLGTMGSYKLPLASSSINETDTIVRIPDGQIVAIGGLMQMETSRQTSGLPGSSDNLLGATVLGNRANSGKKKELVVLIKPTIIRSSEDWQTQTREAWEALDRHEAPSRVIQLNGSSTAAPVALAKPVQPAHVTPPVSPAMSPTAASQGKAPLPSRAAPLSMRLDTGGAEEADLPIPLPAAKKTTPRRAPAPATLAHAS